MPPSPPAERRLDAALLASWPLPADEGDDKRTRGTVLVIGGAATTPGSVVLAASQAFFVNQALIWRSKYRQEFLIQQLRTDSHSPPRFRVQAPMAHSAAFRDAFACKPGDAMVAEPRLTVW